MRRYIIGGIIGGIIACLLTITGLFIPAIIDLAPNDMVSQTHPQFFVVRSGFNQTTITMEEAK